MLLGLLTALYFQRRCRVTCREAETDSWACSCPLYVEKRHSCGAARSPGAKARPSHTQAQTAPSLQKHPPGKLEGFLRSTAYTHTQGPPISFHLSSYTNTHTLYCSLGGVGGQSKFPIKYLHLITWYTFLSRVTFKNRT